MVSARRFSGSASAYLPLAPYNRARVWRLVATSACSGPRVFSPIARARWTRATASASLPAAASLSASRFRRWLSACSLSTLEAWTGAINAVAIARPPSSTATRYRSKPSRTVGPLERRSSRSEPLMTSAPSALRISSVAHCDRRHSITATPARASGPSPRRRLATRKKGRRRACECSPAASRGRVSPLIRRPNDILACERRQELPVERLDQLDIDDAAVAHRQLEPTESLFFEACEELGKERSLPGRDAIRETGTQILPVLSPLHGAHPRESARRSYAPTTPGAQEN